MSERAFVSTLRPKLPNPFNMVASRTSGQKNRTELPTFGTLPPFDLSRSFSPGRGVAQGMLVQYLAGTCKWYAERTKARRLSKGEVPNIRTKTARQKRDRRLLSESASFTAHSATESSQTTATRSISRTANPLPLSFPNS